MQFLLRSRISLANSFLVVEISDDFYANLFVIIAVDARGIPETFFVFSSESSGPAKPYSDEWPEMIHNFLRFAESMAPAIPVTGLQSYKHRSTVEAMKTML